jgi:hypothetical protein
MLDEAFAGIEWHPIAAGERAIVDAARQGPYLLGDEGEDGLDAMAVGKQGFKASMALPVKADEGQTSGHCGRWPRSFKF